MGRNDRTAITAIGAIALTLMLASPAGATVKWVCDVPDGEDSVTFVSVSDAARHGIKTANQHAGATFTARFGEICTVVED